MTASRIRLNFADKARSVERLHGMVLRPFNRGSQALFGTPSACIAGLRMFSRRNRPHGLHHSSKALKGANTADPDDGLDKDFVDALTEIATASDDPAAVWTHLELLSRYVANLLAEPAEWSYRKISTTNPYYQRVAKVPGAVW